MAGSGKSVAVINIHHLSGSQIILDIIWKPIRTNLDLIRSRQQLLRCFLCLLIRNFVHIGHNGWKRELDHLKAITLPEHFRIADQTLNPKGWLGTSRQHQCPGVGDGLADPQQMGNFIQILNIHCHIGFHPN